MKLVIPKIIEYYFRHPKMVISKFMKKIIEKTKLQFRTMS